MNQYRRVRGALSYANVMATVAVVLALGGTGYAASNVASKDVRNNSLRGIDIRNRSLTGKDVRDNSLRGIDVRNSSLTSRDVRNGALRAKDLKPGQVVAAAAATTGAGRPALWTFRLNATGFTPYGLPPIPGIGQFVFSCAPTGPGAPRLFFDSESDVPLEATSWLSSNVNREISTQTIGPKGHTAFGFVTPASQMTLQLAPKSDDDPGPVVTAILSVVSQVGSQNCDVVASVHAADPEPVAPIDAETQSASRSTR